MKDDRTRLRELVSEQAPHEERQPDGSGANTVDSRHAAHRLPTTPDSEQAQDNLERMLETGEENPIS